jgi:hypothetical protein
VAPGDGKVVQDDVVVAGAADRRLLAGERVDLRATLGLKQNLKHRKEKL